MASLAREMEAVLSRYTRELGAWKGSGAAGSGVDPPRFPSAPLLDAISACVEAAPAAERAALEATVEGLRSIARAHSRGSRAHTRHIAQEFLNVFLDVEEVFEGRSLADAVEELRGKNHSPEEILAAVLAHQGSACRHEFVLRLLNAAVAAEPRGYRGELRRLATLENPQNVQVAHRAKQMLEQSVMTGLQALVSRALSMDDMTEEAAPGAAPASPGSPTRLGSFSRVGSRKIQRKATRTETLFSGLEEKQTSQFMDGRRTELATTQAAVEEALASLLGHDDAEVRTRALLTYVERVYYPFLDKVTLGVREVAGLQVATWRYSHATDAGGRGAEHAAAIALLPSLSRLPDVVKGLQGEQLEVLHLAVTGPIERASELSKSASRLFTASMKQMEADGLPNFAQPQSGSESDSELGAAGGPESAARYALALTAALNSEAHALAGLGVASVSALRPGGPTGVVRRWGFVQNADSGAYEPDPWTRPQGRWQVEPPVARLLELSRLGPQTALYCPSRDRQWHLYVASEKPQGGARGAALSRVFLRGVIRQISAQELALAVSTGQARPAALTGAVVNGLEPALCSALDELERAHFDDHSRARRADWVHIFFSVLPVRLPGAEGTAEAQEVADALRAATLAVARRRSASLRHLKIAGWEFRVRSSEGSPGASACRAPPGSRTTTTWTSTGRAARPPAASCTSPSPWRGRPAARSPACPCPRPTRPWRASSAGAWPPSASAPPTSTTSPRSSRPPSGSSGRGTSSRSSRAWRAPRAPPRGSPWCPPGPGPSSRRRSSRSTRPCCERAARPCGPPRSRPWRRWPAATGSVWSPGSGACAPRSTPTAGGSSSSRTTSATAPARSAPRRTPSSRRRWTTAWSASCRSCTWRPTPG